MNDDKQAEGRVIRGPDIGDSQSSSLRIRISRFLGQIMAALRPPRFAKYRPAARVGTRRVESRLLRRLAWNIAETTQ